MKNQGSFSLDCLACSESVAFDLLNLDKVVVCPNCGQKYGLGDESLKRQLKKFQALCLQIKESEEILGNAEIAVELGKEKVQIPFKLLLTRLKSTLNLQIADKKLRVSFRTEPTTLRKAS
jgi:hypothetical protein